MKQNEWQSALAEDVLTEFINGALGLENLASNGTLELGGSSEATICDKSLITKELVKYKSNGPRKMIEIYHLNKLLKTHAKLTAKPVLRHVQCTNCIQRC